MSLLPANKIIKPSKVTRELVLDTGADRSAITSEVLKRHGYAQFKNSNRLVRTATGTTMLRNCKINGLTLANQFHFDSMTIDVLENWEGHTVVGVIGMDILSQMTFILSHVHKKFLLTNKKVLQINELFQGGI